MNWLTLILSLPTENATARMRAWRSLKACGAAVLRDGVYLLPARDDCEATLVAVAADVQENGGMAYLLRTTDGDDRFPALFDRTGDYAGLLTEIERTQAGLAAAGASDGLKQSRKLRKAYAALVAIDYFPGEAQRQLEAALADLERAANRLLSPDEPRPVAGDIVPLSPAKYQGRVWATRQRPWVDRLASAWLIRRFIDPAATFLWLVSSPGGVVKCPAKALGFDFDGATFSHVGAKVTFEVLLASFGLDRDPALQRLGALVHYLDVGGVPPAEAGGVESVLGGLRECLADDDALLTASSAVFEGLLAAFQKEMP